MEWILIIILGIAIIKYVFKRLVNASYKNNSFNFISPQISNKKMEYYSIVGIRYRKNVKEGDFIGTVRLDYNNSHDDYAVAVYDDANIHLGFIPRGENVHLYKYLEKHTKGRAHFAYGYIEKYKPIGIGGNLDLTWRGRLFIPFGFSGKACRDLWKIRKSNTSLYKYRNNKEFIESDFFEILEVLDNLYYLIEGYSEFSVSINGGNELKSIINNQVKNFELHNDIDSMTKLKSFSFVYDSLAKTYKKKVDKLIAFEKG